EGNYLPLIGAGVFHKERSDADGEIGIRPIDVDVLDIVLNHFGPEGNYLPLIGAGVFHKERSDADGEIGIRPIDVD
ncbi:hypothetical protein VS877_22500, partial [Salmonella enterica subsp. enterica serovar Paratyphi A]|nr:hypothetical protein [Salmonella enterica subsp. enterica serovar Paratyphi A]